MELIARHQDREAKVHVDRLDDGRYAVSVDDRRYIIDVATAGDILSLVADDGRQLEVAVRRRRRGARTTYEISGRRGRDTVELVDPLTHLLEKTKPDVGSGGVVEALMPGRVVEILVEVGAAVDRGQGVVVVEAMKMKNEIQAEVAGTVSTIHVQPGQNVEGGDPLFEIT